MPKIAESTVRRLSLYLRFLEEFEEQGTDTVRSRALAARGGTTSAQVRKDLSLFGSFGKRGLGYSVPELAAELRKILGLRRSYRVAVIGAGKIGQALLRYKGFSQRGFHITMVYDSDPEKVGTRCEGLVIRHKADLGADLESEPIDIAILSTPVQAAQEMADQLVRLGVKAILNFAPVQLSVPGDVSVKDVNMALELETLSFALSNH